MGGIFGIASKEDCVSDLFYGTDYHSHLGTRYGGMAVRDGKGIERSIHNIENSYFRTKFEPELAGFRGGNGIGVISDTDPQPLFMGSHLGTFGVVTRVQAKADRTIFPSRTLDSLNPLWGRPPCPLEKPTRN
jgi:amidophosphoribosyltransferase